MDCTRSGLELLAAVGAAQLVVCVSTERLGRKGEAGSVLVAIAAYSYGCDLSAHKSQSMQNI